MQRKYFSHFRWGPWGFIGCVWGALGAITPVLWHTAWPWALGVGLWWSLQPRRAWGHELWLALATVGIVGGGTYAWEVWQPLQGRWWALGVVILWGLLWMLSRSLPARWNDWAGSGIAGMVWLYLGGSLLWLGFFQGRVLLPERWLAQKWEAPAPEAWNTTQQTQALAWAWRLLATPEISFNEAPLALQSAPMPAKIVVTLYAQGGLLARGVSPAPDVRQALQNATLQALRQLVSQPVHHIQIDLLGPAMALDLHPLMKIWNHWQKPSAPGKAAAEPQGWLIQMALQLEPGIDGLEIKGERLMLPSDPLHEGWWSPRIIGRSATWAKALAMLGVTQLDTLKLSKFRTFAFAQAASQEAPRVMFRGKVLVKELEEPALHQTIQEAGRWLVAQVQPNGQFQYEYLPAQDWHSQDYNIVRHAGSVYGLFQLAAWAKAEGLNDLQQAAQQAGEKAFQWLLVRIQAPAEVPEARCVIEETGLISSGTNALAFLSFVLHPESPNLPPALQKTMQGVQKCLAHLIDSRGAVFSTWAEARREPQVLKESLYYPGETLLALAWHFAETRDEASGALAQRVAAYQLEKFQRRGSFDHWTIQALAQLERATSKPEYTEAIQEMGLIFTRDQTAPVWADFPDEAGTFWRVWDVPRTTRAASRLEALRSAWESAQRHQQPAERLENALLWGAKHLMEQQFGAHNSFMFPRPSQIQGAIPMGLIDVHCRIDNNQHAIVGLIGALEVLRQQNFKRRTSNSP